MFEHRNSSSRKRDELKANEKRELCYKNVELSKWNEGTNIAKHIADSRWRWEQNFMLDI